MGWTSHHRRGDVLRAVGAAADEHLDGLVPMDVTGVPETFGDEATLLAALHLRWHARLARHLETAADARPLDRETAAVRAWCAAADDLPGTRLVLDRSLLLADDRGPDDVVLRSLRSGAVHDHLALAAAVGRASTAEDGEHDPGTVEVGARLERLARNARAGRPLWTTAAPVEPTGSGLLDRLRAVLPV